MTSRAEATTNYAEAHVEASKKGKGRWRDPFWSVLDAVVNVTGWSRGSPGDS